MPKFISGTEEPNFLRPDGREWIMGRALAPLKTRDDSFAR